MGSFESSYLLRSSQIDNVVYKLHYRWTVIILVVCSFTITCRLLFGDSFTCTSNDNYPSDIANMYCYSKTPFLVLSAFTKGAESLYPGVSQPQTDDTKFVKSFYPWVNLFFLLLAMIFYLPHLAWKIYEKRLISRVTFEFDHPLSDEVSKENAFNGLVRFLKCMRGKNTMYAAMYVFTEVLNFIIDVILTVWLVRFFHIHTNLNYTPYFKLESWEDFFNFYFPLTGKCTFYKYSPSGIIAKYDHLCLMPLNHLYGYMFLFLYAWFIVLCLLSAGVLLYRFLTFLVPPVRQQLLSYQLVGIDQNQLLHLSKQYSFGDFILLNFLKKNLLPHDFSKLVLFVLDKEHAGI